MIETIKYHINQFLHFPFDIDVGNLNFYMYWVGFSLPRFNNYSRHEQLGYGKRIRWVFTFGYSLILIIDN